MQFCISCGKTLKEDSYKCIRCKELVCKDCACYKSKTKECICVECLNKEDEDKETEKPHG